jgi:hypothetical protein
MGTVSVLLGFASGVSVGFILGRVFERWEFLRKGYRLPRPNPDGLSRERDYEKYEA